MVVTSRCLGYKPETLRNAGFQQYMLQDLTAEQIENFLEKWHSLTFAAAQAEEKGRKQARLKKAITESRAIRELAGTPLLLTMMAILNRNQDLPRDRVRLYEKASEVLLYQWDVGSKVHEQADLKYWQIDLGAKQTVLRKVAHHMQTNKSGQSGNIITKDDLERILTDYLKTLGVDRARAVAKIMIEQLRERNFVLCYLGEDQYAFVHRTFLEYFCASEFIYRFEKEKTLNADGLKALYGEHFQDEAWGEVLRLIAGMIEPRFVGEIIDYLLDQSGKLIKQEDVNHLLLAADCLSEVRSRSEISIAAERLFACLKNKVEEETPWACLDREAAIGRVISF